MSLEEHEADQIARRWVHALIDSDDDASKAAFLVDTWTLEGTKPTATDFAKIAGRLAGWCSKLAWTAAKAPGRYDLNLWIGGSLEGATYLPR